jgi:ferric-dicitrate binding protein FerR (iron transport regulator)
MLQRFTPLRNVRTLLVAAAFVVCLAPLGAQSIYNATVVEQLGQVSVQAAGYLTPLSAGSTVSPQQVIVTGPDGYARFMVSDGSTFEVFNNARVMFREHLGNWKDLLNVWLGRVKVFIQHEPGKPNHNEVSSPTAVISVRGTVFDVVVEDDDGTTLVTVDEGTVLVSNKTALGEPAILNRGGIIRVFRGQPLQARAPIDKENLIRRVMKATEDAVYQVLVQRRIGGSTIPGGGGVPASTQGDKGKGGTTTTPGSPPPPPGSPPPPPGGD